MDKRKIIRRVGIIFLIVISCCLLLFIILPMMILPPYPASLFVIASHDNMNHTVKVEIFNSENNSIFLESFDVKPDILTKVDRGFEWCPKNRLWWLSWEEGSYTFHVTLDDVYNTSYYTELYPIKSVWISIDSDDENPLQVFDSYRD